MLYFFLLYFLTIIFFAIYFKKKKYLSNYSGDNHQLFTNGKNIPLVGGIFLVIPILSINYNNIFYILIILSIFMLGFLSDRKVIISAKQRFLLQIIIIFFSVIFLDLRILSSRILFFDNLLELLYFNILFTCFCLLILINGSNFIDGLNGLLLIYMTTVIYVLLDTSLLLDTNVKLLFESDGKYILFFVITLIVITILNLSNSLLLGDAGAYILSFFVGYLIITCHNSNPDISPYFFITLLWYPCYENLFSIIRKLKNKFSPLVPDNNHLHQLIYQRFNKIISDKVIANNASSILMSIINGIILLLAARYPYESSYQIKIILISIFLYTSTFFILNSSKSKY